MQDATAKIESALGSLPLALQRPTHLNDDDTMATLVQDRPYVQDMRHYLQISARHKLLVIHRAFLARGASLNESEWARAACLDNAHAILHELHRGQQAKFPPSQTLWTIPYHAVAAAVVLALDLMQNGYGADAEQPDARHRREEIFRATKVLETLAPTSRIARRGLQVAFLHFTRRGF